MILHANILTIALSLFTALGGKDAGRLTLDPTGDHRMVERGR